MGEVVEIRNRCTDSGLFESIIGPHFAALYNAAYRLTMSRPDAEDLVQEVCIKAYSKLAELQAMQYQKAWLLRILYNHFIDDQRRHHRSPEKSAHGAEMEIDLAGPENLQPEKETERMMRIELIQNALQKLGKEQCSLLSLHDIEGFSLAELHDFTGLPIGTIKSKLHRARIKLGRLLHREKTAEVSIIQTRIQI